MCRALGGGGTKMLRESLCLSCSSRACTLDTEHPAQQISTIDLAPAPTTLLVQLIVSTRQSV